MIDDVTQKNAQIVVDVRLGCASDRPHVVHDVAPPARPGPARPPGSVTL